MINFGNSFGNTLSGMAQDLMDYIGVQSIFVADLIIESRFVHTGTLGDFINMRSVVTFSAKTDRAAARIFRAVFPGFSKFISFLINIYSLRTLKVMVKYSAQIYRLMMPIALCNRA